MSQLRCAARDAGQSNAQPAGRDPAVELRVRNLLGGHHPMVRAAEGDPERVPALPGWMRALDTLTPIKALGSGWCCWR